MGICSSNLSNVLEMLDNTHLSQLLSVSSKIKAKIIEIWKKRPPTAVVIKQSLHAFSVREKLTALNQNSEFAYDKTSTQDPMKCFFIWKADQLMQWVEQNAVPNSDNILTIAFYYYLDSKWLAQLDLPLNFDILKVLDYSFNAGPNITFGKVDILDIYPNLKNLPEIKDVASVRTIHVEVDELFDLSVVKTYPELINLAVFTEVEGGIPFKSLSCSLRLESLSMKAVRVDMAITGLRELTIDTLSFDNDLRTFIVNQRRLCKLTLRMVSNILSIGLPLSLKALQVYEIINKKNKDLPAAILKEVTRLKLRSFCTDIKFENPHTIKTGKLKKWELNGIYKEKTGKGWRLIVRNNFDINALKMNVSAAECEIQDNRVEALQFVGKTTKKLTLNKVLNWKKNLTLELKQIKELNLLFKVNDEQAKKLSVIFPQFKKKDIVAMGTDEESEDC